MKRLLIGALMACCSTSVALGQIAPGTNPDAGPTAPPGMIPGQEAPPLDEAALRDRMAQAAVGRIAVQAVQGTPMGPAIGVATIEILLVHRGQVVHRQTADLDEHGVAVIEGLPVAPEVTPVVQVSYGGVFYQQTGSALSLQSPEAKIEVTVYELTDERPDWHITMRHVMIERTETGLGVMETVVTNNPDNRTWRGVAVDDSADAHRNAAQFLLPQGAQDVELGGGFHGWCCTTMDDSGLMSVQMPMMPGQAQFRFSYTLPVTSATADLLVGAPVPIDHMIAFIADDGTQVIPDGMKDAGVQAMGSSSVHMYQADDVLPGKMAGLSFAGLTMGADLAAVSDTNSNIKLYAAIGGGLVLLAGVIAIFLKSPRQSSAAN